MLTSLPKACSRCLPSVFGALRPSAVPKRTLVLRPSSKTFLASQLSSASSIPTRFYATEPASKTTPNSFALISPEVLADRKSASRSYKEKMNKSYPPFEMGIQKQYKTVQAFAEDYKHLEPKQELSQLAFEEEIIIYGRIVSRRLSGKKLAFYTLVQERKMLQIVFSVENFRGLSVTSAEKSADVLADFAYTNDILKRGDIIAVRGVPYRTAAGELSLRGRGIELVAPCLHAVPASGTLEDKDIRYRFRHVDLLSNPETHQVFVARATILSTLRKFLNDRRFVEVETPMLSPYSGGAAARPFSTHMLAQDANLYLRIAPELYLKQLVVGGMERVFEIGKSFRNEGVDATHNPEFTTCEFYQAYANYEDLMETTQEYLKQAAAEVNKLRGGDAAANPFVVTIDIPAKGSLPALPNTVIDFSKPFRRINLVEELEKHLGHKLPDVNDAANAKEFEAIISRVGLSFSGGPKTTVKMFDMLVEHFIEPQCVQPTFLCNHPLAASPLAREHRSQAGVTERFELFIARMELCNAYTELNDPEEQRLRFQNQMPDGESVKTNEDWYCGALEWGLPPTGGWGMGLDRLTMILTNRFSIKEVMLFPYMKPHENLAENEKPL